MFAALRAFKSEGVFKRAVCQWVCVTLGVTWFLGLNAHTLRAQDIENQLLSIGIPAYETQLPVESGYVRIPSDSLHLEIPLGSFPQRAGQTFKAALVYDSNIWQMGGGLPVNILATDACPNVGTGGFSLGGWRLITSADIGCVDFTETDVNRCSHQGVSEPSYAKFSNFDWTAPDGTTRNFLMTIQQGIPNDCGSNSGYNQPLGSATAQDNSGFHISSDSNYNITVLAPDGTVVYQCPWNSIYNNLPCSTQAPKDPNGNYFASTLRDGSFSKLYPAGTIVTSGTVTDSVGRTLLTASLSGTTVYLDVLNSQGTTSRYTISTAEVPSAYSFDGNNLVGVIQSVQLPDGTSYSFLYDCSGNPACGGATLSRAGIISMTLPTGPTGGQIKYSYANRNWNNQLVTVSLASRTTPDSATPWNYALGWNLSSCTPANYQQVPTECIQSLTVTKPSGDNEVYTLTPSFGDWPTEAQYYQGAINLSNLLATINQTFWNTGGNGLGAHLLSRTVTLPVSGSSISTTSQFSWESGNSNLLTRKDWDFGSNTSGNPDRTTTYTYWSDTHSAYATANILNRVASKVIANSSGTAVGQTQNTYDDWTLSTSGATGLVHHDDTNYGTANTVRGNLTQAEKWLNTTGGWLTTKNYYDIAGNLIQTTDPNSNSTYFSHTDNFYGVSPSPPTAAYVTTITKPVTNGVNHIERYQYYLGSGQTAAHCGQNFPSGSACAHGLAAPQSDYTSLAYDTLNRPTAVNFGDGGQTDYNYYTNPTAVETKRLISGTTWTDSFLYADGLGRDNRSMTANGEALPWDQLDTCYDLNGRSGFESYPYQGNGTSTPKVCAGAGDSFGYDGLDRTIQAMHSDGTSVQTSYTGRAKMISDEGNGSQRVQRIFQFNSFGDVTAVCEVSPNLSVGISGSQTASACGLDIGGNGFLTTYSYNALNDLTSVTEGPLNSRAFTYDSLSRLTIATNPESGTICYGAVSSGVCQQNGYDANGNLITRTDARGIVTTYSYDQLNRLTFRRYSDGTLVANFVYDLSSNPPLTCTSNALNPIGRLSESSNDVNAGDFYCYDPMGRVTEKIDCPWPSSCSVMLTQTAGYDLVGDMTSSTNGLGQTLTYSFNPAQRVTSVSTNATGFGAAGLLFSAAHYNPAGLLTSATLGNGINETRTYDGRLRLNGITDGSAYSLSIPTSGGYAPNSDILSANDSANGNWTYTYDALDRLATANATGQSYTYAYDRFGNRWQQNGPHSSQAGFDANNHMVPGGGVAYDVAGNTTNDGVTTYSFDAEERISTATNSNSGASSYVYGPEGTRIGKTTVAGGTVDFLYDIVGHQIAQVTSTGTWMRGEIYIGKRHLATLTNSATYYDHSDWLGTERARSTSTGTLYETCTSLPFGDWLTCSGGDPSPMHFTGKEHDNETSLEYFGARYHSSQYGRFMTPDWSATPAALYYADLFDPQSLNLYSYMRNNPVFMPDADGHQGIAEKWDNFVESHPRTVEAIHGVGNMGIGILDITVGIGVTVGSDGLGVAVGVTGAVAGFGTFDSGFISTLDAAFPNSVSNASAAGEATETLSNPLGLLGTILSGGDLDMGKMGAQTFNVVLAFNSIPDLSSAGPLQLGTDLLDLGKAAADAENLIQELAPPPPPPPPPTPPTLNETNPDSWRQEGLDVDQD